MTFSNRQPGACFISSLRTALLVPGRGSGEKGGLERADVTQPYIKASCGLLPAVWKQLEGWIRSWWWDFFFPRQTQTQLLSKMQTAQKSPSLRPFKQRKSLGKALRIAVWILALETAREGTDFCICWCAPLILNVHSNQKRGSCWNQSEVPRQDPGKTPLSWGVEVGWGLGLGGGGLWPYSLENPNPANDLLLSSPSSSDIESWGASLDICFQGDSGWNPWQVIVERYPREKFLPRLDKTKFLVPQELTMTQFLSVIRWVSERLWGGVLCGLGLLDQREMGCGREQRRMICASPFSSTMPCVGVCVSCVFVAVWAFL